MRPYKLYVFKRSNSSTKNSHRIMLCHTGINGHLPDRSIKQKGYGSSINYVGKRDLYPGEKSMVDGSTRILFHFYDDIDELIEDEKRFENYDREFIDTLRAIKP